MLKTPHIALFVVLGIVFWFAGAMIIRLVGEAAFQPGNPLLIVLYVGSFPLLYVTLVISSVISRLPQHAMLQPTVIMTFTAIFIDGVVIAWMPQFYGETVEHVMRGAAWLLFAGAAGLFCAWLMARRAPILEA
ncbi:MAG: hypothetical protein SF162_19025 [bacterium]|nr:hypothetical protein [bacterium]